LYALIISGSMPTSFFVVSIISVLFLAAFLLAGIFGPTPQYDITDREHLAPNDSTDFLNQLESLADAKVNHTGDLQVLKDGSMFYEAELDAIRHATRSINLEAYIFQRSAIGQRYLEAMTERARAGVKVNIVLDAFGSLGATRNYFRPLTEAGGKVGWYNSPTWYRLTQLGNRTHRELLVVDGKTGFIGGAGIADQWYTGSHGKRRWRDTMVRIEGDAVTNLQATFAENWLAVSGELLNGEAYFPPIDCPHPTTAMIVNSTATIGGSTRARVLFQVLLASARHSISITTPYFLPDKSLTREICRAIERGVKVRVLVPGRKSDHLLTRSTSRGAYGPFLKAGAEVYEYQPAMIHAKILCIDHLWSVVGSTNFDNRSFGINDEVNLAVRDADFTGQLEREMTEDIHQSCRVSLDEWQRRPFIERGPELLGWIFERQQ